MSSRGSSSWGFQKRSKLTKARLVAPGAADTQLSIVKNDKDGSITVRKPAARVDSEWTIVIE